MSPRRKGFCAAFFVGLALAGLFGGLATMGDNNQGNYIGACVGCAVVGVICGILCLVVKD